MVDADGILKGAVSEGDLVSVSGFLHRAMDGSSEETVNCGGKDGLDTHMNVNAAQPVFIDFSEAIRVDRAGASPWVRLTEARAALERGLSALQVYFRRYRVQIEIATFAAELVESVDRFGVLH